MKKLIVVFAVLLCPAIGLSAEPGKFDVARLKPFWLSTTMDGESVLFIKENAEAEPKASVLFEPTKILTVCSSSGATVYTEGKDYVWKPGTREIVLPKGSKIPFKMPQDLCRAPKSQMFQLTRRDGKGEILFGAGHEYHDMQTLVSYTHKPGDWKGPVPCFAGKQLPQTLKKLKEKQPLTLAMIGDSISTGCNASGWAKTAPFQPAWQDLFVMNLEATYGSKIAMKNFAVGGTGSEWGLANIGKVAETKPDLVILAFGMNDSGGVPTAKYQANIKGMIDAVRKAQPNAEFILIATMLGNKDWTALNQTLFGEYREALRQLCGQGVALADMTSMWTELFKYKLDRDMTGNGVNHPNDFGHRIYAEVLSALLIPGDRD